MALTEADDQVPRIPSSPAAPFRCDHYACTMRGAICVQRQTQVLKGRPRRGPKTGLPDRLRFAQHHCGSGQCAQGRAILEAIGAQVEAPVATVFDGAGHQRSVAHTLPGTLPPEPPAAPPAAPQPTTEEPTMATTEERPKCTECGDKIRRDNSTGLCKRCKKKPTAKLSRVPTHQATAKRASPAATALAFPFFEATGELPDVRKLPNDYLVRAVDELKRRAAELYAAARAVGFDPAAAVQS